MVVRPPNLARESPENNSNSPSSTISNTSSNTLATQSHPTLGKSPKRRNANSMSRKRTTMSPSRPVPRSKSMNGLNRLDANKVNGHGASGRLKRNASPMLQRANSRSSDTNNNGIMNGQE